MSCNDFSFNLFEHYVLRLLTLHSALRPEMVAIFLVFENEVHQKKSGKTSL